MRSFKLLFFLLWLPLLASADDGVVLLLKDGNSVSFAFNEQPVLVTRNNSLVMKSRSSRIVYDYDDVQRFYFSSIFNVIEDVSSNANSNVTFRITEQGVNVDGLAQGESVSVFTLDGKLLSTALATSGNDEVLLRIPNPAHTVYLIKTSTGISYKISF